MVDQLHLFGEHVGMAFQIKDDLMDFGYDDIGKPKGIDIKEKKLTFFTSTYCIRFTFKL